VTAADVEPRTDAAAPTPDPPDADRPWRRAFRAAGVLWMISHIGYGVLFTVAFWSSGRAPGLRNALNPWNQWDSTWFVRIATEGYSDQHCDTAGCKAAFFPLYPMLVRGVDVVLPGGALPAALAVSSVTMLAALAFLYRLLDSEFGGVVADRALWYMIAFPTAFFLAIGYNESLFLLLAVASIYLMRRGDWLLAGALAGLAAATRSVGLLLLVPFIFEYVRQHGRRIRLFRSVVRRPEVAAPGGLRPSALAVLLIPAGLGAFMLYTWATMHDAFAFSHAQRQWGRKIDWPWVSFAQTFRNLRHTHPLLSPNGAHLILELWVAVAVIVLLVLAFVGPWRLRRDQWALPAFGAALALAMISVPSFRPDTPFPLMSSPRLALEVFPAFVVLARIGANRTADRLYLFIALALQGAAIVQFLNGGWVA
jgi:Mannosyltransferase (PIG-V)